MVTPLTTTAPPSSLLIYLLMHLGTPSQDIWQGFIISVVSSVSDEVVCDVLVIVECGESDGGKGCKLYLCMAVRNVISGVGMCAKTVGWRFCGVLSVVFSIVLSMLYTGQSPLSFGMCSPGEPSPLHTTAIVERCTLKLVDEYKYMLCQATEPLSTILEYITMRMMGFGNGRGSIGYLPSSTCSAY
ncbi:hypothetical protein Tco_0382414 [Tanacetum coccineum]